MQAVRKIETLENGNVRVTIPIRLNRRGGRRQVILAEQTIENEPLLVTIARGRRWQKLIDEGTFPNSNELAKAVGRDRSRVAATLRLAMLAPAVIHRIIVGDIPSTLTFARLRHAYSAIWEDQVKELMGE